MSAAQVACRDEATAADAVVASLKPLAQQWRVHTSSQAEVDRKEITAATASARWAESKAAGPEAQKAYAQARTKYDQSAGACAKLSQSERSGKMQGCASRIQAIGPVTTSGRAIAQEWATHLEKMTHKGHTDTNMAAYWTAWRSQVAKAPAQLATFDRDQKALSAAPTCVA